MTTQKVTEKVDSNITEEKVPFKIAVSRQNT